LITIDERLERMAHKAQVKAALYWSASKEYRTDGDFVEAIDALRAGALFDHLAGVLRAGMTSAPKETANGGLDP
jgi:hypothetical protein